MSNFMNKREIIKAYDKGYLDEVKQQLVRYGTIKNVKDWQVEEGYYKGANRRYHIEHHGLEWEIEMLNGEVRTVGYKLP